MAGNVDKRTGNFLVAASDASAGSKKGADYICDGTADEVDIQAALDALLGGGGAMLRDKFHGEEWFSAAQSYWESQFPSVKETLLSALQYVEPHPKHRCVFSQEFARILKESGSIFGSVADDLVRGAGVIPRPRRTDYDIVDYCNFLREEVPDIHRRTVDLRPAGPKSVVVPFEELETKHGIPAWWRAYNKVKHRGSKESRLGNLENCVRAVSGLALLGGLMGVFSLDDLFVKVAVVRKEDSVDLSRKRRLFPRPPSCSQLSK
jgi:hypothetical protein